MISPGSGTIRRCGPVGVGVALLEEVWPCWSRYGLASQPCTCENVCGLDCRMEPGVPGSLDTHQPGGMHISANVLYGEEKKKMPGP